jgi:hypothetical protein
VLAVCLPLEDQLSESAAFIQRSQKQKKMSFAASSLIIRDPLFSCEEDDAHTHTEKEKGGDAFSPKNSPNVSE